MEPGPGAALGLLLGAAVGRPLGAAGGLLPLAGVEAKSSSQCGGGSHHLRMPSLARSAMVSVATQKIGGKLVQPMGKVMGKATSLGWPGSEGKATPSLVVSLGWMPMQ